MPKRDPAVCAPGASQSDDLEQRVARYRARLIAEGRMNSVRHLDRSVAAPGPDEARDKGPR